jgi:hypothetical protein
MEALGVSLVFCRKREAKLVEQQPEMDQLYRSCPIDRRRASASRNGGERSTVGPPEAWAFFQVWKDGINDFRAVFHKLLRH